jgi:exodeoxyribonuclease-5
MESLSPDIFHFLHFSQPTKEQREVLSGLEQFVDIRDQRDFLIISGAAGTGKTSLIAALIGYLNHKGMPYHIAAPTGRAARLIGRKSKSQASTIHSMIYKTEVDEKSGKAFWKLKEIAVSTSAVYIIDEASMISKEASNDNGLIHAEKALLYDLIEFVKKGNVNNKIIFLGDRYQLPPVFEKTSYALEQKFLEETFNLKGYSYVLTEVKRQQDGSYILDNATNIRKAIDRGDTSHPLNGKQHDSIYAASRHYVKQT